MLEDEPLHILSAFPGNDRTNGDGSSDFPHIIRLQMGPVNHIVPIAASARHIHRTHIAVQQLSPRARARTIMHLEIVRDSVAVIAIIITLPYMALTHADDPVYGITILLWGQVAATVFTWGLSLIFTVRAIGTRLMSFVRDMLPYVALTGLILPIMHLASEGVDAAWLKLTVEVSVGATLYIGANLLLRSRVQKQVFDYLRGRKID